QQGRDHAELPIMMDALRLWHEVNRETNGACGVRLPEEVISIRDYVEEIREEKPLYLLFTHSDYDHIIGYGAFPEATVIASQAFVDNPNKEAVLLQILEFDQQYYLTRNYPIRYPEVQIVIRENGQHVQIGRHKLSFYLTPGHNSDGIYTILEPEGIWIAGDYLSNIEFPYIYHSTADYLEVLELSRRLLTQTDHKVRLLIPGHGDHTTNEREIQQRIEESFQYIDRLAKHLKYQSPFDLEGLWKHYQFQKGMQYFHDGNVRLMRRELGLDQN
ncbi:MAG: MBL fold metallo-hydrolase, partial [Bacteroidota bacterium]